MNKKTQTSDATRELLLKHYRKYPCLQTEDVFKYVFQSSFGCEHLVSDEESVIKRIKDEREAMPNKPTLLKEALDGAYSRVYLSWLDNGLKPETLARLFLLSAKKEPCGADRLEEKLSVARELVLSGELPLDYSKFEKSLVEWRCMGYPAVRHSEVFRSEYKPSYRVIANRYADFIEVFASIDRLLSKGGLTVVIEGGSASGKSTLAEILGEVYDCNLLHMDDFFLRPEQRTPERFAEVGGNIDRERFGEEILVPLLQNKALRYRRFDCSTQSLGDVINTEPKRLTVVEGAYSMHPAFGRYYGLSIFLDIDKEYQRERILIRNSPQLAKRFFEEWIPLEDTYFEKAKIKEKSDILLNVTSDK